MGNKENENTHTIHEEIGRQEAISSRAAESLPGFFFYFFVKNTIVFLKIVGNSL